MEDIFELFKSEFNLYIKNSNIEKEKEKEKEIKNNDEIKIDDIPHNYHINIRLKFLELINKKGKNINDKIIEYINIEILLPIKKFNFKDKKKFTNLIENISNKNKKNILENLLIKIENNNTNIFNNIDEILYYEYILLEFNYQKNILEYKEIINKENINNNNNTNNNINYEIILMRKNLKKFKHINNFFSLYYIQNNKEVINEMINFLYLLFNFKNDITSLFDYNLKYLNENNINLN